jgi:hypothetical protein
MIRTGVLAGAAVGVLVSILSFLGNHTPHTVYAFPDLITGLVFIVSIIGGIGLAIKPHHPKTRALVWEAGMAVAMSTGLVFGVGNVIFGVRLLSQSRTHVLAFGFASALLLSLACGAIVSALWAYLNTRRSQSEVLHQEPGATSQEYR